MKDAAIVLANGRYETPNGKTAHGLVRGSDRFEVMAVIEPALAGRDAGEALDGVHRGIPIVASIDEALAGAARAPRWCVIGIATHGGRLLPELRALVLEAIGKGLSIVNGLHDTTAADPEIAAAARERGVELVDLRRTKPLSELHFWEGYVHSVRAPRVAVLGTDCALGKRTTTYQLVKTLTGAGLKAEMIYTGQTGWMQGARYGIVFDSIVNDFVCGELEHAIVTCEREAAPEVMVIEGQSSLRNPSGPCGAEMLVSAVARGVVLQHAPGREFFEGYEEEGFRIPSVASEIELIRYYGARTLAITVNGKGATPEQLARFKAEQEDALGIPVVDPIREGLDALVPVVRRFVEEETARD